jgi:hypothetical protein
VTVAFIEDHRGPQGFEPVCGALRIALSTYYERRKRIADPELRSARKVWIELKREGLSVARCTVE